MRSASSITLGGQAVIDGVMVRSPRFVSVVIRAPQGHCDIHTRQAPSLLLSRRWLRAPFVRGVVALIESLSVGTWALVTSARAGQPDHADLSPGRIRLILVRSLAISIALFFLVPTLLARVLTGTVASPVGQNLLEGAFRIALLLGFLVFIGRIPAIQRVFQYHGAEHKAIHAYEAGLPLDVDSARRMSRFHPRCGTSFLLFVLLVATAVFAVLGDPPLLTRLAERLLLLPVVAAASYEVMRLAQRARGLGALTALGLWLQRLTTRDPDDQQLGVALAAVNDVLANEHRGR